MIRRTLCALLSLAALLAGCAGPSVVPGQALPTRDRIADFSLEARFSLTQAHERHAGRLSWRHAGERDELLLSSPFGQGVAEITLDRGYARLVASDRQVHEAADAEALTRDVLGYPLPIERLSSWLLGRGTTGAVLSPDSLGRPRTLASGVWFIEYEYGDDSRDALPSRLSIRRSGDAGPEILLRIEEWRVP